MCKRTSERAITQYNKVYKLYLNISKSPQEVIYYVTMLRLKVEHKWADNKETAEMGKHSDLLQQ